MDGIVRSNIKIGIKVQGIERFVIPIDLAIRLIYNQINKKTVVRTKNEEIEI